MATLNQHILLDDPSTPILEFQDHASNPARLVSYSETSLPPLYGHVVYFTNAEASSKRIFPGAFLDALIEHSDLMLPGEFRCQIHLKIYFMLRGDENSCIEHYRREREAVGCIDTQIGTLNQAGSTEATLQDLSIQDRERGEQTGDEHQRQTNPPIPGFVRSDLQEGSYYRPRLYIMSDLQLEQSSIIPEVSFDHITPEEYEKTLPLEWRGDDDPSILLETALFNLKPFVEETFDPNDPRPVFGSYFRDNAIPVIEQRPVSLAWTEARDRGLEIWPRCVPG